MDIERYQRCLALARRCAYSPDQAEDLLHTALLIAAQAGRLDFNQPVDRAWLAGVMRKQAALLHRGHRRGQLREQEWERRQSLEIETMSSTGFLDEQAGPFQSPFLSKLPPAACQVAVLILHGLDQDEIRWILRLSATAMRQRLSSIRKVLSQLSPHQKSDLLAHSYLGRQTSTGTPPFGLLRRALLQALQLRPGIGANDPDGHLLIIDE